MFGGGSATINIVKNIKKKSTRDLSAQAEGIDSEEIIEILDNESEEEIVEEGIDVHISLPHKK